MQVKATVTKTDRDNLQDINLYLSPTGQNTFLGKVIVHLKLQKGWSPVAVTDFQGAIAIRGYMK